MNLPGKYNNIIRMRLKRLSHNGTPPWNGNIQWTGHDPVRKKRGDYRRLGEVSSRSRTIAEPEGIDSGFVIAEWDMSGVGDGSGGWDDCIIHQIRIQLSGVGTNLYEIDWVEIGGLKAHKYLDGTLRAPLRTEKSTHRTRGTWAKIKYSAKTTDKFNIFAILAKYRKIF